MKAEEIKEEQDVIYLVDEYTGDNSHEYYATNIKELKDLAIRTLSDYHIVEMEIDTERELITYKYDRYGTIEEDSTNYSKMRRIKQTKTIIK